MQTKQEFTIVTFNAHSCVGSDSHYSVERIAQTLLMARSQAQNVNVVCLQEVENNSKSSSSSSSNRTSSRTSTSSIAGDDEDKCRRRTRLWSVPHNHHQPHEIAKQLDFPYTYFVPAVTSQVLPRSMKTWGMESEEHDRRSGGGFGNAILSKHVILESKVHVYSPFSSKTRRNVLACRIQLDDDSHTMWVVTTHLGVHPTGAEQYQQSQELVLFLDTLKGGPVVLCGDFNSLSWYRSIQLLLKSGSMRDVWDYASNKRGGGSTFPSAGMFGPSFRLDYIFLKSNNGEKKGGDGNTTVILRQKDIFVLKDGVDVMASDHLALCAVFDVIPSSDENHGYS